MVMTVPNQVDWLIKQATGPAQLVSLLHSLLDVKSLMIRL
jgi:hypothetical protein